MKKILCVLLTIIVCFTMSGCADLLTQPSKLTNEEVVTTFLTAYQEGDYEGIKPFITDDNPLHRIFAALEAENPTEMDLVYQVVYEQTKDFTYTLKETSEPVMAGMSVDVQINNKKVSTAIDEAMDYVLLEQAENGGDSFANVPLWMVQAVTAAEDVIDEEFTVYVSKRNGSMELDTSTNRKFFRALCGNFVLDKNPSMTICTSPDGSEVYLFALGDEIFGMIDSDILPGEYVTEEALLEIYNYIAAFESVNGTGAFAQVVGNDLAVRLAVNFDTASSTILTNMGIMSGKTGNTSNSYLSLKSSIRGYEESGMTCVTNYFGNEQ